MHVEGVGEGGGLLPECAKCGADYSDYLGTHQCSKNAKLGEFEQSLNVCEFGKKRGVFIA